MKTTDKIPEPLPAGETRRDRQGFRFRVFANDSSSGRPWCWGFPTLEDAQRLAKVLCIDTAQEVEICEYVGCYRRKEPAVEFVSVDTPNPTTVEVP